MLLCAYCVIIKIFTRLSCVYVALIHKLFDIQVTSCVFCKPPAMLDGSLNADADQNNNNVE